MASMLPLRLNQCTLEYLLNIQQSTCKRDVSLFHYPCYTFFRPFLCRIVNGFLFHPEKRTTNLHHSMSFPTLKQFDRFASNLFHLWDGTKKNRFPIVFMIARDLQFISFHCLLCLLFVFALVCLYNCSSILIPLYFVRIAIFAWLSTMFHFLLSCFHMHALHDETTSETFRNFIAEKKKKSTSENSMTHSSRNTSSKERKGYE